MRIMYRGIGYSQMDVKLDSITNTTNKVIFDSVLIFIYIESVYLSYFYDYNVIQTVYNICSIIAIARLFYAASKKKFKVNGIFALFFSICITSGIICMLFTNNLSFEKVIDSGFFSLFVGALIIYKPLNEKVFLLSSYINIAYFLVTFAINGIGRRVLVNHSNNYISIILLYSLTIYYLIVLKNNSKILVHPALLGWIIALMARGRSGIICLTILFLGIFIYTYFKRNKHKNSTLRYYSRVFGFVTIIVVVSYFVYRYSTWINENYLIKFSVSGLKSRDRIVIINEYLSKMFSNIKYFLFGVPKNQIKSAQRYNGNLHNSFLDIHAYNGLLMVLIVFYVLIKNIKLIISKHLWVFGIVTVSFLLRGLFDTMFWGVKGTAIFYAMLLFFVFEKEGKEK